VVGLLVADLWGNSYQWPAVTLAYFLRYPKFVLLASHLFHQGANGGDGSVPTQST